MTLVRPICRFFLMGACKYGPEECTGIHEIENGNRVEEVMKTIVCQYFLKGKCRHKDRCYFSHELPTEDCASNISFQMTKCEEDAVRNVIQNTETACDLSKATKVESVGKGEVTSIQHPTDHLSDTIDEDLKNNICGICHENIITSGKRFANLSECSHSFCHECIRSWHRRRRVDESKNMNVRYMLISHSCPICRVESNFVLYNRDHLTGETKVKKILEYKKQRENVTCKYFNGEIGNCPHGKSCIFAHVTSSGKDMKQYEVSKREMMMRKGVTRVRFQPLVFNASISTSNINQMDEREPESFVDSSLRLNYHERTSTSSEEKENNSQDVEDLWDERNQSSSLSNYSVQGLHDNPWISSQIFGEGSNESDEDHSTQSLRSLMKMMENMT